MTPRRPRGRRPDQPLVDLASVFADDELLDSLAAGHGNSGLGAVGADDPLPELFQSWRTEMTARPLPAPPSTRAAAAALSAVVDPKPARALRPVLAASVAIVALLLGSAVLFTRTATESSPLWGIASVIWQDRAASVDARNEAKQKLTEAKAALDAGSPDLAEAKLQEADAALKQVNQLDNPADVKALWDSYKSQSEDSQQASALASSSAESVRSSSSSSATSSRTTRNSPTPVVEVPTQEQAPFTPTAGDPTSTPAAVTPARMAPPVVDDPFLSLVDPTSSAEVVTPPLLPPPPPTDPVTPVEPATPEVPTTPEVSTMPEVSTTPDVPTTPPVQTPPVQTPPVIPPDVTLVPTVDPAIPTTTTTTTPELPPVQVPGDVPGQQQSNAVGTPTSTSTSTSTN